MTGPLITVQPRETTLHWMGWAPEAFSLGDEIPLSVLARTNEAETPKTAPAPPADVTGERLSFPAPGHSGQIRMGNQCLTVGYELYPAETFPLNFRPCDTPYIDDDFYVDDKGGLWWGDGGPFAIPVFYNTSFSIPDYDWHTPTPQLNIAPELPDSRALPVSLSGMTLEAGAGAVTAHVDSADDGGVVRLTGSGFPGSTVTLTTAGAPVGTAVVSGDGTWTATTTALPKGEHDLAVAQDSVVDGGTATVTVIIGDLETPLAPAVIAGLLLAAVATVVVRVRRRHA